MTRLLNKTTISEALFIFGFSIDSVITKDIIMKKFRKLSLKHHPDKGGDARIFAKVAEAKEILIRDFEVVKTNSNGSSTNKFNSVFVESIIAAAKIDKTLFTTYRQRKK